MWLHNGLPQRLYVLGTTRFAEAQIDDATADPAYEARGIGQVDEARAATVEVHEGAEEGEDADGVVRYTTF